MCFTISMLAMGPGSGGPPMVGYLKKVTLDIRLIYLSLMLFTLLGVPVMVLLGLTNLVTSDTLSLKDERRTKPVGYLLILPENEILMTVHAIWLLI